MHICPGVNLAGSVTVDQFTQVGIGSSVIQGIKIGHNCQVGAGSVVIKNVKDKSKVVGVPAKDMVNFASKNKNEDSNFMCRCRQQIRKIN